MSKITSPAASTDFLVTQEEMLLLTGRYGLLWRQASLLSEFDQSTKTLLIAMMESAYQKGKSHHSERAIVSGEAD